MSTQRDRIQSSPEAKGSNRSVDGKRWREFLKEWTDKRGVTVMLFSQGGERLIKRHRPNSRKVAVQTQKYAAGILEHGILEELRGTVVTTFKHGILEHGLLCFAILLHCHFVHKVDSSFGRPLIARPARLWFHHLGRRCRPTCMILSLTWSEEELFSMQYTSPSR